MDIFSNILIIIGMLGAMVCGIWMLVLQFQTSILWGLACLFIPFAALVWLVMYWDEGKIPFLYSLGFVVLIVVGLLLGPGFSNLPANLS